MQDIERTRKKPPAQKQWLAMKRTMTGNEKTMRGAIGKMRNRSAISAAQAMRSEQSPRVVPEIIRFSRFVSFGRPPIDAMGGAGFVRTGWVRSDRLASFGQVGFVRAGWLRSGRLASFGQVGFVRAGWLRSGRLASFRQFGLSILAVMPAHATRMRASTSLRQRRQGTRGWPGPAFAWSASYGRVEQTRP
jgi:hypothetical protein